MLTNILIGVLIVLVIVLIVISLRGKGTSSGDIKSIVDKSNEDSIRRINESINNGNRLFNDMIGERISLIDKNIVDKVGKYHLLW